MGITAQIFSGVKSFPDGITGSKISLSSVVPTTIGSIYFNDDPIVLGASGLFITISGGPVSVKSFIIDHPNEKDKHLVHACLEGPEAGVYYRGKAEINNNKGTVVYLPKYVESLAHDLTIQVTPIHDEVKNKEPLSVSEIQDNKFTVYGSNGKFYWIVYGKRASIDVEPFKKDVIVKGDGPYKYVV